MDRHPIFGRIVAAWAVASIGWRIAKVLPGALWDLATDRDPRR